LPGHARGALISLVRGERFLIDPERLERKVLEKKARALGGS
jgi:hypothetical protein